MVLICLCVTHSFATNRWKQTYKELRKATFPWPALVTCGTQFVNEGEVDEYYELTQDDVRHMLNLFAQCDVMDNLFLSLDPDTDRANQHLSKLHREQGNKDINQAIAQHASDILPSFLRPVDHTAAVWNDEPALRDKWLEDSAPTFPFQISRHWAMLDRFASGESTSQEICGALTILVDAQIAIARQLQYTATVASGLATGIGSMSVNSRRGGSARSMANSGSVGLPLPAWVSELSDEVLNMAPQKVEIGSHPNKDTTVMKVHREARNRIYDKLLPDLEKYGSFAKLPTEIKLSAVDMLGQKPLCWTWDQTSRRLTSRCAHVKSTAKEKAERLAKRRREFGDEEDADAKARKSTVNKKKPTRSEHTPVRSSQMTQFEVVGDSEDSKDDQSKDDADGSEEGADDNVDGSEGDAEEEPGAPSQNTTHTETHTHTHFHAHPPPRTKPPHNIQPRP